MIGVNLFLVVLLIMATAFFVAAEFAIVKIRSSRVDQLIAEGNSNAVAVQKVTSNLDGYLSACQLGITVTALGLGWLGEPTIERMLNPLFVSYEIPTQIAHILSFVIAFSTITFLHVVIGELAPKTVAIQKAESVSLLLAKPLIVFYRVMYPFIWALNGSAAAFVRLFGLRSVKGHEEDAHSEEELRIILSDSYESGEINQAEYGYVKRIFAFDDLLAREIMVPRTDMVCLYEENTLEENLKTIREEQYTRYPLVHESKDNIIGIVNTKELFLQYVEDKNFDFTKFVRPAYTVLETTPIKQVLKEMQKEGVAIAILVDEYGGTAGLVTIEDILEEIVGDIRDEFDSEERSEVEMIAEGHYLVDGKVSLSELKETLDINLDDAELDTVGGWLYSQNPLLKEGEEWESHGLIFKLRKKDRHRFRKLEVRKPLEADTEEAN